MLDLMVSGGMVYVWSVFFIFVNGKVWFLKIDKG